LRAARDVGVGAFVTLALAWAGIAAAGVQVVGIFPNKAVLSVDGGPPKSVAVGESVSGYKVVAVSSDRVTVVGNGIHESLPVSAYVASASTGGRSTAILTTDSRGHYQAQGSINGAPTRFVVDTGATLVVLSKAEADRLAIRYIDAPTSMASTANGTVPYRVVKLDRVKVGDVELTNVDAAILEGAYEGPNLLGMSFLSRTEVSRDGPNMVLTRRF
jgi:aspartyl protease family protein